MSVLARHERGAGGEIQLTDGMAALIGQQPFHGSTFEGRRFDCGSKAGYVQANIAVSLLRDDLRDAIQFFVSDLVCPEVA